MLSRTAQHVLLDASPLCRFAECSRLSALRAYLGSRARITREVERELLRLAERAPFISLTKHLRPQAAAIGRGAWPKTTKPLPDSLKADFANLLALKHAIGEHDWAHSGEIATVLMAEHSRVDLVMIDDGWGAGLARGRGLRVMSTARLVLEMVVADALSRDDGFRVFDAATPEGVGRDRFETSLSTLRSS
ncbi:MAG: hypothetical protein ACLQUT_08040 [Thermoleophilia bacterium]